jgi:hypothetical protein
MTVETSFNEKFLQMLHGSTGTVFTKRGRRPQPLHGQPDAVLSGASSQKLVFFCKLLQDISKKSFPLVEIFFLR